MVLQLFGSGPEEEPAEPIRTLPYTPTLTLPCSPSTTFPEPSTSFPAPSPIFLCLVAVILALVSSCLFAVRVAVSRRRRDRAASTNGQVMERSFSNDPGVENLLTTLLKRLSSSNKSKVHEKIGSLIDLAKSINNKFHAKLNAILERSTNAQVHGKLDAFFEQAACNNVDEKPDTILDRSAASNEDLIAQMMKLDERRQVTEEAAFAFARTILNLMAQRDGLIKENTHSAVIAQDNEKIQDTEEAFIALGKMMLNLKAERDGLIKENTHSGMIKERRRQDAEEAAIALERTTAQRKHVLYGEIVELNRGKGDLLKEIENLKAERDGLSKENTHSSMIKERRRHGAEEAAIALERTTAQRQHVEGEIVGLNGGNDDQLKMIESLKAETDGLIKEKDHVAAYRRKGKQLKQALARERKYMSLYLLAVGDDV